MNKTQTTEITGKALQELSDIAACVAGDMHTLHLNMKGCEFDVMHKEVFKTYYEEADSDYDEIIEWSACFGNIAPNKNSSAERISYQSLDIELVEKEQAVQEADSRLSNYVDKLKQTFNALENIKDCPISIGISNWLQGRLEYWAKEVYYFNARRLG